LYKYFHSVHHKAQYSISIAVEYFHPVEYFVGVVIPFSIPPLLFKCHLLTYILWLGCNSFESITAHSGYDFGAFLPNAREHGYHHSHFANNYGSFFNIWDRMLSTNKDFLEYEKRREEKEKKE
jgi:sterol desaturase/sphingolipid hydroxylase (fatty acid hydroxylase superfamily)